LVLTESENLFVWQVNSESLSQGNLENERSKVVVSAPEENVNSVVWKNRRWID